MKMLVVYDSVFGNTELIAQAIGNGLGGAEDVGIVRAGDVRPEQLTPGPLLHAIGVVLGDKLQSK